LRGNFPSELCLLLWRADDGCCAAGVLDGVAELSPGVVGFRQLPSCIVQRAAAAAVAAVVELFHS
jgi:hypothetical protein